MRGKTKFLAVLQQALEAIREPRFFENERGYQGELIAELKNRLKNAVFPGDPIVEQEHQKSMPSHGITIRPDLIIHIPFGRGVTERRGAGNFVAIELKRNKRDVKGAFCNLRKIKEKLNYPLTILIIVNSADTCAHLCPDSIWPAPRKLSQFEVESVA
ncbi:MAG TPA: hypothetical protein VIX59_12445 [Candidatus Binataceae bacterium]